MSAVAADTHAAVWYLMASAKLSQAAQAAFAQATQAGEPIYLPAISLVEVIYLVERGRLPPTALDRLSAALIWPDSAFVLAPLNYLVAQAVGRIPREAVREMPDRIIAATALVYGVPLVTRDQSIQAGGIQTIW